MAGKQKPHKSQDELPSGAAFVGESPMEDIADGADEGPMTLDAVTGYLLRRAHYLYYTYWILHFPGGENAITPMQSGMLTMLRQYPEMTQTELARRMGIEVPTAFKALKRLQEGGYLERVADKLDKRARTLRLTEKGARILNDIDAFNPIRDSNLLADFTPSERLQFKRLLTKLIVRGTEHLGISQEVVMSAPQAAAAPATGEGASHRAEPDVEPSEPAPERRRASGWRSQNGFRRRRAGLKS